jgi:Asp/Glu/hydantoin racemase
MIKLVHHGDPRFRQRRRTVSDLAAFDAAFALAIGPRAHAVTRKPEQGSQLWGVALQAAARSGTIIVRTLHRDGMPARTIPARPRPAGSAPSARGATPSACHDTAQDLPPILIRRRGQDSQSRASLSCAVDSLTLSLDKIPQNGILFIANICQVSGLVDRPCHSGRVAIRHQTVIRKEVIRVSKKIAILHTSLVFISVEPVINDLISELIPDAEVMHFVDSDVLATVVREHGISSSSEMRMTHLAQAAEAAGADIIFSACSSLGPALDVAAQNVHTPVVKIDEAMAMQAASDGARIGVLATVSTTLGPTSDLIQAKADEVGRSITLERRLCEGAFSVLMSGDRDKHDAMVIEQAMDLAKSVDMIVLAQASMSRLAGVLQEKTKMTVLSSPRIGVDYLARRVAELAA